MRLTSRKRRFATAVICSVFLALSGALTVQAGVVKKNGKSSQTEAVGPGVSTKSSGKSGSTGSSGQNGKTEQGAASGTADSAQAAQSGQSSQGSGSGSSAQTAQGPQVAQNTQSAQSTNAQTSGKTGTEEIGPGVPKKPVTGTSEEAVAAAQKLLQDVSVTWYMQTGTGASQAAADPAGEDPSGDGKTIVLEIGTFRDWIRGINEDGTVKIDEPALKAWVYAWFEPFRVRTFRCFDGRDVELTGTLGWYTGPNAETEKALEALKTAVSAERTVLVPADPSWGTTYIECDLKAQHVYFFRGGQVVWDSPCVSGMMTEERKTPEGLWAIYSKETNRDLKGTLINGQPSYVSHVDYWMPFHGGCGLHDASWRSKFGGSIYVNSGSHGCVNLPPKKAAELYALVQEDTPVVVHY